MEMKTKAKLSLQGLFNGASGGGGGWGLSEVIPEHGCSSSLYPPTVPHLTFLLF